MVNFNQGKKMPTECIRCYACEDACPQNIKIVECLDRIKDEILSVESEPVVLMRPSDK